MFPIRGFRIALMCCLFSLVLPKTSPAATDHPAPGIPSTNATPLLHGPGEAADFVSRFYPSAPRAPRPLAVMGNSDVPLNGWNEPSIAVNPTNPLNLAYASLLELRVSTDGGTTWQPAVHPEVPSNFFIQGDPLVTFDHDGRLFWSYIASPLADHFHVKLGNDILVAQCDPATGAILPSYPVNVTAAIGLPGSAGYQHDKEWLAADTHAGSPFMNRLYLVWTVFPSSGVEITLTSHSSDQGRTWSTALQLGTTGAGTLFVWPAHNTVAPNGDVYVAERRQPGFSGDAPNGISGFINVYRSTDGGVSYPQQTQAFTAGFADITWNRQTRIGAIPGTDFLLLGSVQPYVLADPKVPGRVYVVANDDPDNNVTLGDAADVFIVRSSDFGATWSAPVRVDGGPATTLQVMPTAAIDPVSGAIVVHYYDNRNGAVNAAGNYLLDVFAAVSSNGGQTFAPDFQINDQPFDPDAGARCRFDCGSFASDVWADAGGTAFAVGFADGFASGHFIKRSGGTWSSLTVPVPNYPKLGVWGSSPTDVFTCGLLGEILHYDGVTVTAQASNTTEHIGVIDGRASNDVIGAGDNGVVVHYNGATWSVISPGTPANFNDIWANPTGDTWIVGEAGNVFRYDGSAWTDQSIPTTEPLGGVWGSSDDDVYVTSWSGDAYHWNGAVWSPLETGLAFLTGVWGSSATDVRFLGWGRILRYDGVSFSQEDVSEHLLWRIHGSGAGDAFVVGELGLIAHFDGSSWTPQFNPLAPTAPTKRIGEYNGLALAGGSAYMVWCGNRQSGGVDVDQQSIFSSFSPVVSVVDLAHRSTRLELEAPRPNPTRQSFSVAYSLPVAATVDLSLFDVSGRRVATLVRGEHPSGRHVVAWSERAENAPGPAAGLYFLRLDDGTEMRSQRLVLIP